METETHREPKSPGDALVLALEVESKYLLRPVPTVPPSLVGRGTIGGQVRVTATVNAPDSVAMTLADLSPAVALRVAQLLGEIL